MFWFIVALFIAFDVGCFVGGVIVLRKFGVRVWPGIRSITNMTFGHPCSAWARIKRRLGFRAKPVDVFSAHYIPNSDFAGHDEDE